MNEVFSGEVKSLLKSAHKLYEAGEKALAREMCVKCVKNEAKHNKMDVLTYFYGDSIYNKMNSPEDALCYIYISKCAKDAYSSIEHLTPANSSDRPWAVISSTESDPSLVDFFKWLKTADKKVEDTDSKHFEALIKASKNRKKVMFKMAEKLKGVKLTEIISFVVHRSRTITEDGELR